MSNSKVPDNPPKGELKEEIVALIMKHGPIVPTIAADEILELITSEANKRVEAVLDRLGEKFNVLETKGEALSAIRAERQRLNKEGE